MGFTTVNFLTGDTGFASARSSVDSVCVLLGDGLLTGSPLAPVLTCSNIDIKLPVGAIDPESTTSPLLAELIAPTLSRRGVLALGLGLALRLAANVAAMKLGLL